MQRLGGSHAHSRVDAEIGDLVRTLRGFGVLTYGHLKEFSGGEHWSDPVFDAVLHEAVRSGRIRRLSDDLYELDEEHPGG